MFYESDRPSCKQCLHPPVDRNARLPACAIPPGPGNGRCRGSAQRKMNVWFLLLTAAALVAPGKLRAAEPANALAVRELIGRYAPQHVATISLETVPAEGGRDAYELETVGGKLVLRGNSGVALASAFYHYLKEFCHAHISWNGDQLRLPAAMPAVPAKVRVVSPVKHRMAYNYCTHGYTMPFWDKSRWDRELDWLALHGVNMILVIQGQEAVWQNTFTQFGYTKEEMRQWLCSPVHQPWQFMQNMEGVLPPPQAIIDKRTELGRYIVERARRLGIRPILQGYYGMLPSGFAKKHPDARIHPQGGWAGNNRRPDMLNPGDPLYPKLARAFMEEQRKIYGDVEFLAADPFHEGGTSAGMDRGAVYKQVQDAMLEFDPKITLVKQCWQTSNKEMFDRGQKEKSLALDLNCDFRPFWQKAKGYDGTPWVWSFLYNFGGNLALEGNPAKLVEDFGGALASPAHGRLEGISLVPEGSQTNPLMYELMTEMGWRGAPADTRAWVSDYLHARYGAKNTAAEAAWDIILGTAYAVPPHEGPINSVITGRPSMNLDIKGREWAPGSRVPYDNRELAKAWAKLQEAAPALGDTDTYRYDLADVARQVLVNHARVLFEKSVAAIKAKDATALKIQRERMLGLLADLDELTGTRPEWLMGAWVADAAKWGANAEECAYMDKCARIILTTWVENPNTNLTDYANREWNGLLGQYYATRWRFFFDAAEAAVGVGKDQPDMGALNRKRTEFEVSWINSAKNTMSTKPKGDTVAISRKFIAKYGAEIASLDPVPRAEAPGLEWNPALLHKGSGMGVRAVFPLTASQIKSGKLTVEFTYTRGAHALVISEVALEADGKVVATDKHEGVTGLKNENNRYTLAVPASAQSARKLALSALARGLDGQQSHGTVKISGE